MDMPIITRLLEDVDIAGYLLPWDERTGGPLLLQIQGWWPPAYLVPIFSTDEKLWEALAWIAHPGPLIIKAIGDPTQFIVAVGTMARTLIGADLYRHGEKVRWTAVVPADRAVGSIEDVFAGGSDA